MRFSWQDLFAQLARIPKWLSMHVVKVPESGDGEGLPYTPDPDEGTGHCSALAVSRGGFMPYAIAPCYSDPGMRWAKPHALFPGVRPMRSRVA